MLRSFEIVIPAYNEEDIIKNNLNQVYRFLDSKYDSPLWTLTLANNASTDRTGEIGRQLQNNLPKLKVIDVLKKGKGHAVYDSWKQSKRNVVAFFDADLSVGVESLPRLIESVSLEYPMVIGSRFHKDSRVTRDPLRSFASWNYNKLLNFYLRSPYSDHQCGFKAMLRQLFLEIEPALEEREWFFDSELLYYLSRKKIPVKEIPVVWSNAERESRVISLKSNSIQGLKTMRKLRKHPPKINKWPKKIMPLSAEQIKIKDDFMKYWHEVLPAKYGLFDKFNQGFPVRFSKHGGRVLEIGAGLGEHISFEPLSNLEYYALELRPDMAGVIKERFPQVRVIVGDCQEPTGFTDNYFDRVNAVHVLEHLPNLPAALKEIQRILKPTGELAVVIPCEGSLAYLLARKISAERLFVRRYKTKYDFFIKTEHINLPKEIFEELDCFFRIKTTRFFPLILPINHLNLGIGLILEPKKKIVRH